MKVVLWRMRHIEHPLELVCRLWRNGKGVQLVMNGEVVRLPRPMRGTLEGKRVFDAGNVPLRVLIEFGYEIPTYQLVGGPAWLDTYRFDIAARAGRDAPLAEVRLMMQSLLEERFKFKTHRENREITQYALVVDKGKAKLNPATDRPMDLTI